ncbi:beta-ketoacyl-ACP synthase III [Streptomyces chumphonensis]|uniref:Beta-ketoacyl-[acyl-carrier-protein] synthase III n=1 Tax=Streptomyces chumphonensis TaxID=1214925 RepID=A0A927F204_9ACTN|nr:beta-ketoacyl-ACP synthase III [Streptomyces chumphonensis]MBD3934008.1 ketoacyl-ACP synthase III [Streptomyces chumphonensis]
MAQTSPSAPSVAVLCGLGGWVPPRIVDNAELSARLDTTDAWITERTGIRHRRHIEPGQATSDLAVEAGRRAVRSAGGAPPDAVLVATTTPDRPCPATAPVVAARLGLAGVPAFDVAAVCTGFLYALATASGLLATGAARRVLVIGADAYSTIVDPGDRTNAVIFGDGAGAVVLRSGSPEELGALGPFDLGSDGAGEDLITVRAGGSRQRSAGDDGPPAGPERFFEMHGRAVYRHAVVRMSGSARAVLDAADWKSDTVAHVVPHQANLRILRSVVEHLGLPEERLVTNIRDLGNTGAASVPLALCDAAADGRLTPGDGVLLTAFGGGLTWGSCVLRWPALPPTVRPATPADPPTPRPGTPGTPTPKEQHP